MLSQVIFVTFIVELNFFSRQICFLCNVLNVQLMFMYEIFDGVITRTLDYVINPLLLSIQTSC